MSQKCKTTAYLIIYTQGHAKWAISTKPKWVCVVDINRDKSQEKRGGGTICFENEALRNSLSQIQKLKPS